MAHAVSGLQTAEVRGAGAVVERNRAGGAAAEVAGRGGGERHRSRASLPISSVAVTWTVVVPPASGRPRGVARSERVGLCVALLHPKPKAASTAAAAPSRMRFLWENGLSLPSAARRGGSMDWLYLVIYEL